MRTSRRNIRARSLLRCCGTFRRSAERIAMLQTAERALDRRLPQHRGLYYGGAWHASFGGRELFITCPATGEALGTAVDATVEDVDGAVSAARAAFLLWRDIHAQQRAKAIRKVAVIRRQYAVERAY